MTSKTAEGLGTVHTHTHTHNTIHLWKQRICKFK